MPAYNLSVADLASRLAAITGNSESYHSRQVRAMNKEGALVSPYRGGSHATAPVLYSDTEVGRAIVLHTLSELGLQMPMLKQAAAASMVVDPTARKGGHEPADGIELALSRLRADPKTKLYLHLSVTKWPEQREADDVGLGGWVSTSPEVADSNLLPPLATIVLPLHRLLAPLVA